MARLLRRKPRIVCVADLDWVQGPRLRQLQRHLPEIRLDVVPLAEFARGWKRGRYRNGPVYLATWRFVRSLEAGHGIALSASDLAGFMVSVTSHYNVGGGLAPETAVPRGTNPEACFAEAVDTLSPCAVVTVNSSPLYELLSEHVPNLVYAPNGVDTDFFVPPERPVYDSDAIRIGWAGKVKAAKNFDVVVAAADVLRQDGFVVELLAHPRDVGRAELDRRGMRDFYHRLDYHLCASWHEGTPNPALEAAACGVPLVSTRVGNMVDLIRHGENGFFVEPTAESIVATFRSLRPLGVGEYIRLRATTRATVLESWTWDRAAEAYRSAFAQLLDVQAAA